ncbi:hypothetical protein K443DRAFT_1243 [Laccaria amethystina LaAM-08-1]|uniref:Uncharacterized protein n=1 Tax=Laccaria amethystina LaAM-08-1 TaxID=1095629 RepID=A0A0C9XVM0_9AGAR|nr:hypothetical protein K443DRAFT_1243 [Laccaria amethystina LaAM-08-1]
MQDYRQVLLDEWIRSGRKVNTRPYKRAPAQKIQLLEDEEASITGTWDRNWQRAPTDVLEERSQVSVFRSVSFRDKGRLKPPPASISMALNRNHPISHLPGMNSNYGGTDYEDNDQPNPWTQVQPRHRSKCQSTSQANKNTRFAEQNEEKQPSSPHERHNPFSRANSRRIPSGGFPGGGPPDDDPPDGNGPPGGGYGSRPAPGNGPRCMNETPFSRRQQSGYGQGPPGGDPPGAGPDYGIEQDEGRPAGDQNKAEWQLNNKISYESL